MPVAMGAWSCNEVAQFPVREREFEVIGEWRQDPTLWQYFDHWFVADVLMPRQCTVTPINNESALQIGEFGPTLKIVDVIRIRGPFRKWASFRNLRFARSTFL